MKAEQLKKLEDQLWTAADQLRANSKLTATEYSFPVLGLIFLRHAFSRFTRAKEEIEKDLPVHPQRGTRPITKDDFIKAKALFLPEKSRWEYLSGLPEGKDIGQEIDEAMREIEREHENLTEVLPKNYTLFEKDLLHELVRIFTSFDKICLVSSFCGYSSSAFLPTAHQDDIDQETSKQRVPWERYRLFHL